MLIIKNKDYAKLNATDLLICALGYEPRSCFLFEENIDSRNRENTLVFRLDKGKHMQKCLAKIKNKEIQLIDCEYKDSEKVYQCICNFLKSKSQITNKTSLYIDYSSMPRSWYCPLPVSLSNSFHENIDTTFFYVAGDYPDKSENYPTAGIDSISVFSGLSLPAVDIKRFHIMGLGYDRIRTETVKSIIEPDLLITCYVYNPIDINSKEKISKLNKDFIKKSLLTVALPINNFSCMVDKLCELVYDQVRDGQVIIIPDGPKPLIMAMSLIPELVKKNAITCLHISRNNICHNKIQVTPRKNEIFGFQVLHNRIT
jgi:hypothetical protein